MPQDLNKIRAFVIDDSAVYRKILSELLRELPEVDCLGTAANAGVALSRLSGMEADLVILDCALPDAHPLEVMKQMRALGLNLSVILLAQESPQEDNRLVEAMEYGAFDLLMKPQTHSPEAIRPALKESLFPVLKALVRESFIRKILSMRPGAAGKTTSPLTITDSVPAAAPEAERTGAATAMLTGYYEAVAIGISTGGPKSLAQVLPALGADFPVPVFVVQHMPPLFTPSLVANLSEKCSLPVFHAADGQKVRGGAIYIAPGGRQMRVVRKGAGVFIEITDDAPENSCRPSVDYLFRSVAECYGARAIGVIMTGMGCDGRSGLEKMKQRGALSIAQDEHTSVVYGMPREVIRAGLADIIAPLEAIAGHIIRHVTGGEEP